MSQSLLSSPLLRVAIARINDSAERSEANLRRATSDLYYAMFHAMCEAVVEPFAVQPESEAFLEAYTRLYRQPEHGHIERRCKEISRSDEFTLELRRFAKHMVTMKNKRELADYHPLQKFMISVVRKDCEITETMLAAFWAAEPKQRAAFVYMVAINRRGGRQIH